ncbi:3'-5' exoribonuclease domain-containing protein [Streptomyces albidoflavus]|uniref:3'-5' exoribonuclease domain-containing protein n=1 Tax=Streptomyces albidoflavus TaxID=1886 RepID=UPI0034572BF3
MLTVVAIDYDLEFLEDGRTIDLISIGMVTDDGREYYAVNSDAPWDRIKNHPWLMRNVWPHLPLRGHKSGLVTVGGATEVQLTTPGVVDTSDTQVRPHWVIANEVRDFIQVTPDVELWANYGAYDHVALCQLWGRMIGLPEGVPMFTHDIQQEARRLGLGWDDLPQQETGEHNALADARHNRTVRRWLAERNQKGA